jgi:hypothetical protein
LSEKQEAISFLPAGFRSLSVGDVVKPFATGDSRMDSYTLKEYHVWSLQPNELVIVCLSGDQVAGIIEIIIEDDFLIVEKVAKNLLVDASGVGTKLMSLAEGIARFLRKERNPPGGSGYGG